MALRSLLNAFLFRSTYDMISSRTSLYVISRVMSSRCSFKSFTQRSMITVTLKSSGKGSPLMISYFFMSSSTCIMFFSMSSGFLDGLLLMIAFSSARLVPGVRGS